MPRQRRVEPQSRLIMNDIKTILLTTDLSEVSKIAVDAAVVIGRKFEARIVLAHVGDLFMPYVEPYSVPVDFEQIQKDALLHARRRLEEFAASSLPRDLDVDLVVPVGVPHIEIVNLAQERNVDLIVMAPHGRGFISHLILGSTTERVLRRAPCPVLVVRKEVSR
jgi:nucleotide-binding universal stress UspA family protein